MGWLSSDTPAPDPLIGQSAQANAELSKESLDFSKTQYADQQAYLEKLQPYIDKYLSSTNTNLDLTNQQTAQQFQDQQTMWRPQQQAYLKDVNDAGTPERMAEAADTAGAGVQSQLDAQRSATMRNEQSLGVTPDAGRQSGEDRVAEVLGSAAIAGARNSASLAERDRGVAMRAGAAGAAMGNSAAALQGVQVGNQTTQSGTGIGTTPFSLNQAAGGAFTAGVGTAGSLNSSAGGMMLNQYGQQVQAAGQQSAGLGSLLALGVKGASSGGLWASGGIFSDENLKEDKKPVSGRALVKAVKKMRVERWKYKPGVADEAEHIGTYAQDFQDATGQGDGHTLPIIDAIGVLQGALKQTIEDVASVRRLAIAGVR